MRRGRADQPEDNTDKAAQWAAKIGQEAARRARPRRQEARRRFRLRGRDVIYIVELSDAHIYVMYMNDRAVGAQYYALYTYIDTVILETRIIISVSDL